MLTFLFFFSLRQLSQSGNLLGLFFFLVFPIILIWFYFYGFNCYELILLSSNNYTSLSINGATNPLYLPTSFYSVFAGWVQNILVFSGNTLSNYGLSIRYNSFFLVFIIIILVPILKIKKDGFRLYFYCLAGLVFSALLYATLLAIISGHIVSFQTNYSIFSLPFFIIVISVSLSFYKSFFKSKIYLFSVFLFSLVLTLSNVGILFGFDSHNKTSNTFEICAEKINSFYMDSANKSIEISYGSKSSALELNKYLNSSLVDVRQSVNDGVDISEVVLFGGSISDSICVCRVGK